MTITVDIATESIRTDTSSPYTYTHTGAASSGIKGVLVCIMHGTSNTDHVSAVSYGGTALTRKVRTSCSTAEPGAAEIWFLGTSVPQGGGDKTVSVTCGSTTDDIHVVTITLLGSYDLEVVSTDNSITTVGSNPSVALDSWGRSGMAFAAGYSGVTAQTSVSAGTNCSKVGTGELTGNFCSYVIRQTTAGTGSFTIAATIASDDRAFAAAMVTEASPITPSAGSLTLTGDVPLTWRMLIQPPAGELWLTTFLLPRPAGASLTLTGAAPTVTVTNSVTITPSVGSLTLTGASANVNRLVTGTAGTLTLTGAAPTVTVTSASTITPPAGSLTMTGSGSGLNFTLTPAAGLLRVTTFGLAPTIEPGAGSLALTGYAPTISGSYSITPAAGSLTLTGAAPTRTVGGSVTITPSSGSLTLTGDVSPQTYTLPAPAPAALTLTGAAPTVTRSSATTITPASGSLTLTGYGATVARYVLGTAGTVTLTGAAPSVTTTTGMTITPSSGSVTLTGAAPTVTVTANVFVTPPSGSLLLSGASTTFGMTLSVPPGSLTLQGSAPDLAGGKTISPAAGSLTFTGAVSKFDAGISPPAGSLTIDGFDPSASQSNVTITPPAGRLTLTGFAADSTVPTTRPPGGSGYPVYWQGKRRKARLEERPNLHLKAILDEVVRELYGDLTEDDVPPEIQKKAAKLVKPYAEKKAKRLAVPPESAVDWTALEKDAARVRQIVALWREEETRREIDDEDEFMLLVD